MKKIGLNVVILISGLTLLGAPVKFSEIEQENQRTAQAKKEKIEQAIKDEQARKDKLIQDAKQAAQDEQARVEKAAQDAKANARRDQLSREEKEREEQQAKKENLERDLQLKKEEQERQDRLMQEEKKLAKEEQERKDRLAREERERQDKLAYDAKRAAKEEQDRKDRLAREERQEKLLATKREAFQQKEYLDWAKKKINTAQGLYAECEKTKWTSWNNKDIQAKLKVAWNELKDIHLDDLNTVHPASAVVLQQLKEKIEYRYTPLDSEKSNFTYVRISSFQENGNMIRY